MEAALRIIAEKLTQHIQNETALVSNFKQDFKWLKIQIAILRASGQFTDAKDTHNEAVQQWIEDVRDTLWDAEDILDQYYLRQGILGVGDSDLTRSRFTNPKLIIFRYKMGRKIREIKERIKSIMETANELKLIREMASMETASTSASTDQRGGKWKKSSIIEEASFPVAVDDKVQEIIKRLEDPAVQVLALVGMGGIGKTFLLQHVYNKVKHTFHYPVWLSVSSTYSVKQLQRDLAFQLNLKDLAESNVSCIVAAEKLHETLKEKEFLIVLDDVWRAIEEDDLLRSLGIPIAGNNRGKVIVTSRNKEVFSHRHPVIYEMSLLPAEDSWKLFCVHAFPHSEKNSPPANIERSARLIEEECGRLPLAIKTVASSLAKAKTSREWELKLNQLKEVRVVNPGDPIFHILKLSYIWLPSYLKPCFVYLSFFTEDEEIDCEYLVHLWIAEGFIPQTKYQDQVDEAWDYLRQLANLCLVDVWETIDYHDTNAYNLHKYCRVHDLVLDLAVRISREYKSAFSANEAFTKGKESGCRRFLLVKKDINDQTIADLCCAQIVRTLSLSHNFNLNNISPNMLSNAKVLRVLDLSHTSISTLPESIGDLKLLRILNLSSTKLKEVPECVKKLKSLNFLDVSMCRNLRLLPLWIGELVSLQHLNIQNTKIRYIKDLVPKGLSKTKIMSLCTLRSTRPLAVSVEDVANMTSLQEISIDVHDEDEMAVLGGLVKMRTLQLRYEGPPKTLPETMKAMKDLQRLYLSGITAPGWISVFENLRVLHLMYGELNPALETMGNLTVLKLQGIHNFSELPQAFGQAGGFPNLRALYIQRCSTLQHLPEMEDGAMASLEILQIEFCPRVRNVPLGFLSLRSLREFDFSGSGTDECRSRLREEWNRVRANNHHLSVYIG